MDKEQFYEIWNRTTDPETEYKPDPADLTEIIEGYAYVLQTKKGINNVIFKKVSEGNLGRSLRLFKQYLENNEIQYIRIEGNTRRYFFLQKMFPGQIVKDLKITDRNVFYAKIY